MKECGWDAKPAHIMRLLQIPGLELNSCSRIDNFNALNSLMLNGGLKEHHMPCIAKMLELGADVGNRYCDVCVWTTSPQSLVDWAESGLRLALACSLFQAFKTHQRKLKEHLTATPLVDELVDIVNDYVFVMDTQRLEQALKDNKFTLPQDDKKKKQHKSLVPLYDRFYRPARA